MWKNCDADIQGLYHYRRYMVSKLFGESHRYDEPFQKIQMYSDEIIAHSVSQEEIVSTLQDCDIILTYPVNISPRTVYDNAVSFFPASLIEALSEAITQVCPEYYPAYQDVLSSETFSICQMFIARRETVDEYCSWLFGLLARTEEILKSYDEYSENIRAVAYMAEFLLNVYIIKNGLKAKYCYIGFILNEGKFKRILRKVPFLVTASRIMRGLKSGTKAPGAQQENSR